MMMGVTKEKTHKHEEEEKKKSTHKNKHKGIVVNLKCYYCAHAPG